MIDDNGQVPVVPFPRHLIDPDPSQPVETVDTSVNVDPHPGDDRTHGPPRDTHQLGDSRLGALHRQPGNRVIEVPGMTSAVTGPRHPDHRWTVNPALHPRSVRFEPHLTDTQIQAPPPPSTLTTVIPRGSTTTARNNAAHCDAGAPPPSPRRHRYAHSRSSWPTTPTTAAIVSYLAPRPAFRLGAVEQHRNVNGGRGAPADRPQPPTDTAGESQKGGETIWRGGNRSSTQFQPGQRPGQQRQPRPSRRLRQLGEVRPHRRRERSRLN